MMNNKTTKLAAIGLLVIFGLSALNALFYSIGYAFSFKTGTYIISGDYMADFFKIALSYPKLRDLVQSGQVTFPSILAPLLNVYYKFVAYHGVDGLSSGQLTHFHLPPFTTGLILISISAFVYFGFICTTLIVIFSMIGLLIYVLRLSSLKKLDSFLLFVAIVISYPFIFLLQRGNFVGFYAFIFTVIAVMALKQGSQRVSVILMSIAINIRPNLSVFVPLFYFMPYANFKRPLVVVGLAVVIFLGSAFLVNQSYSDYTLVHFLAGLDIYKEMYIVGDWGFGYNTSIYNLLKLMCKILNIKMAIDKVLLLLSFIGFLLWVYAFKLYYAGVIQRSGILFLLATISMLFTPVFADYHLLIFALPLIFALEEEKTASNFRQYPWSIGGMIVIACCIMLSPLNYVSYDGLYIVAMLKILTVLAVSYILISQKYDGLVSKKSALNNS
jgi:hypothetical protein